MEILAILLGGLLVGALARVALPGRDPLGCLGTMAVGVAGGALGGFLGRELLDAQRPRPLLSLLFSVIGAMLVLLVLRGFTRGRRY